MMQPADHVVGWSSFVWRFSSNQDQSRLKEDKKSDQQFVSRIKVRDFENNFSRRKVKWFDVTIKLST